MFSFLNTGISTSASCLEFSSKSLPFDCRRRFLVWLIDFAGPILTCCSLSVGILGWSTWVLITYGAGYSALTTLFALYGLYLDDYGLFLLDEGLFYYPWPASLSICICWSDCWTGMTGACTCGIESRLISLWLFFCFRVIVSCLVLSWSSIGSYIYWANLLCLGLSVKLFYSFIVYGFL